MVRRRADIRHESRGVRRNCACKHARTRFKGAVESSRSSRTKAPGTRRHTNMPHASTRTPSQLAARAWPASWTTSDVMTGRTHTGHC